jgi:predicted nucleic acid-binding protein
LINADKTDNKFVDCAFACNADYIVTNDKHFNVLKSVEYPKINILSIEKFAEILKTL